MINPRNENMNRIFNAFRNNKYKSLTTLELMNITGLTPKQIYLCLARIRKGSAIRKDGSQRRLPIPIISVKTNKKGKYSDREYIVVTKKTAPLWQLKDKAIDVRKKVTTIIKGQHKPVEKSIAINYSNAKDFLLNEHNKYLDSLMEKSKPELIDIDETED